MSSDNTAPTISVTPESRVRLPLTLLVSLFTAVAFATAGWMTVHDEVAQHRIEIAALQLEARASRELLVRIDENVKALKEFRR
jgi:hypothetical protein